MGGILNGISRKGDEGKRPFSPPANLSSLALSWSGESHTEVSRQIKDTGRVLRKKFSPA